MGLCCLLPGQGLHLTQDMDSTFPPCLGNRKLAGQHPAISGHSPCWLSRQEPRLCRTIESKDFGFLWGQQRPLEKRGGPCAHITLSTRLATPTDTRAGDLRDISAGTP